MTGEEIAARARAFVGVRFRPQGRDAATGLDCVGLAAAATGKRPEEVRRDYALRSEALAEIEHTLRDLDCRPVPHGEAAAGDIMICEAGPLQLHLVIFAGGSFIHADAGLRRVVQRPCPVPWPIAGVWRAAGEE